MDPILVPAPPKQAYNKNRPISDLIKAQIKHFEHVESKLAPHLRPKLPHHELTTESAAADYIAGMTAALCRGPAEPVVLTPRRRRVAAPPEPGVLPLAAAAEPEAPHVSRAKKHHAKHGKESHKASKRRKS